MTRKPPKACLAWGLYNQRGECIQASWETATLLDTARFVPNNTIVRVRIIPVRLRGAASKLGKRKAKR